MEEFKEILEAMPTGLIIIDKNALTFINCQAKMLLEMEKSTQDEILSGFCQIISPNIDKIDFQINVGGRVLHITHKINKYAKDQSIYAISDLTEIKLLNTKDTANAIKRKLLLSYTHEFRTPLNWLIGALSSISPVLIEKNLLKIAKHATNMMSFYIDDIIYFNQLGESDAYVKNKPFKLEPSIEECISFVETDLSFNKIKCRYIIDSKIPKVIVSDKNRFKQIVNNLLCNSIKSCEREKGLIQLSAENRNGKIYFVISDNGIPLSHSEIGNLLRPMDYLNEDAIQCRNGFGMMICKELCESLKGELYISSYQSGNIYTFYIPLVIPEFKFSTASLSILTENVLPVEEHKQEIKKNNNLDSIRIQLSQTKTTFLDNPSNPIVMIVDDTPFNNEVLKNMLRILKINCIQCTNGLEAVDKIKSYGINIPISFVFMDINMPILDGIQVSTVSRLRYKSSNT